MSSDTTTGTGTTPTPISGRTWRLAVVLALGGVMAGLDSSIVNVGLATIGDDLGSSLAATQWISSGYLLALAAALPVCGWLSRRLGAGQLWLWSLAAFTATSALCAAAGTIEVLIAFRVLQGLAGGVLAATSMTVLAQSAGPAQLGRLMATTSVPAILAPGIGPVLGALLLDRASWPWLFLVNIPVGIAALVVGLRTVPRAPTADRDKAGPLDVRGLLLVSPGLPLLVHAITQAAEHRSLVTPAVTVPLLAGLGLLTVFVRRTLSTPHPLLDLRLLQDRVYRAATLVVLGTGAALFGGLIVMPLYFQLLLTRSIVDTGWLLVPFSLGAAATFPVAGRLTDRFGGARVAVAGLALTVACTLPFALLGAGPDLWLVEGLQVLRGVGLAMSGMPVVALALGTATRPQLPDATTQVNVLSRVGGALGSALFVVVLTTGLGDGASGAFALDAFRTTFWWLTAATVAALLGAMWLVHETRESAAHPPLNSSTTTNQESAA